MKLAIDEARRVIDYYTSSDTELAQRYIGGHFELGNHAYYSAALKHRYSLYPEIPRIAAFDQFAGKSVLEIGVGQGLDHFMFASVGAKITGVDLTEKHCQMTRQFLRTFNLKPQIINADARSLPFKDESFDHVYSCGVLLLFPEIEIALAEIRRVLRPGGSATIMLYNKSSIHYWIKTRLYYGWALNENAVLGRDTVLDWYTDGIGYPKTYHYQPSDLPNLFYQFSKFEFQKSCLTPEQMPEIGLPANVFALKWLEERFGFFLWVRAWV